MYLDSVDIYTQFPNALKLQLLHLQWATWHPNISFSGLLCHVLFLRRKRERQRLTMIVVKKNLQFSGYKIF